MKDYLTLTNEDNMELMARYPDNHFDLAIVDPPYFSGPEKREYYGGEKSSHGVKRIDYKPLEYSWIVPNLKYYNELLRVSKNQIIWGVNYYNFPVPNGRIIWDKVNGKSSFSDCEIASCSLIESVRIFRFMWNGMMQGSKGNGTKMEGDKNKNEKKIHPTQKPTHLYEWLLKTYAKEGDRILDTHLGSGSIAIALDRMNKIEGMNLELIACELDKSYFDAAVKRVEEQTRQIAIQL